MLLETGSIGPDLCGGRIGGFKFFNEPIAILALNATVEASGDDGSPFSDNNTVFEMNFALVGGIFRAATFQDLRVQFSAQAEAIPTFAAFESDSMDLVIIRQFTDGNG